MDIKDFVVLEDLYSAHIYNPLDVVISRGKGVWVWENHGHCHPRIIKALETQAKKLTLTSRAFRNDQWPFLAKEICDFTGYEMVLPMNTGAEAVETAIKAARKWGYQKKNIPQDKAEIIVCSNNFHGRTVTIVGFSTEPLYKKDFGPFTPGFIVVPYGDAEALEAAITPHTAAFMVEPIQAEAGIIVPPEGYLKRAREICQEHNVLFIADEIQTGLGRTGKLFACDYEKVKPDMLILGKSLGGGCWAVSAVLASREVLGLFQPREHGSTFGANPLACAVAREAIRVLQDENMVENARVLQDENMVENAARLGEYFLERLKTLKNNYIKEARGRGLLIGLELKPEAGGARRFCEALKDEGLLLCKETHENIIRFAFAPPLIIKEKELNWAFKRIKHVFKNTK